MARRWLAPMLLTFAALGVGSVGPAPLRIIDEACAATSAAEGEHRAVVIVDTGAHVRRVCVRFSEESITGREALVRAGVDPVFKEYGGKGAFVCKLLDTGCPADDCQCDPDRYWVYSRAKAGASSFTMSSLGVSSTSVRDGDVEGWKWSNGGSPAYASPDAVCGPKPASTTTPPAPAAPTTGGGAGTAGSSMAVGGGRGASATSGSAPGTGGEGSASADPSSAGTSGDPSTETTLAVDDDAATHEGEDEGDGETDTQSSQAATSSTDGEGGTVAGAWAFAVALLSIAAAWLVARRRRQAISP